MRPARRLIDAGSVDFYPLRASQVVKFLTRKKVDVAVIQVSPPDNDGYCSFGVSTSYPFPIAGIARTVIAEVNPEMPRTAGNCRIHVSHISQAVHTDHPLMEYQGGIPDAISARIALHIEPLVPDGATLQIGMGNIPEAIVQTLKSSGRCGLRFFGMGVDGVVDLWESGMLATDGPVLVAAELMGTRRLFDWVDRNARCEMLDFPQLFSGSRPEVSSNFISINSTLEIDLWGNANSEVAGTSQVSGVGGSLDFIELAMRCPTGKVILALTATAKDGAISKIVPRLSNVPHTISRSAVQYVVTEYGAVDLSMLGLDERADAMIGLAAPQFRDELWNKYRALRNVPGHKSNG